MSSKPKILVVDDDRSICNLLDSILGMEGYPHRVLWHGADARKAIQEEQFDILISDIYLGDISGLELLALMKEQQPDAAVVIMTAHGSVETAVNAVHHGAFDYIAKPFAVDEMLEILSRIENLQEDVMLVYRNPGPETFSTSLIFHRADSVSVAAFPEILFKVEELLG